MPHKVERAYAMEGSLDGDSLKERWHVDSTSAKRGTKIRVENNGPHVLRIATFGTSSARGSFVPALLAIGICLHSHTQRSLDVPRSQSREDPYAGIWQAFHQAQHVAHLMECFRQIGLREPIYDWPMVFHVMDWHLLFTFASHAT